MPVLEGHPLRVSIHQSIAVPRSSHTLGAGQTRVTLFDGSIISSLRA